MAYSSKGRKPIERASKISHAEIINNSAVQDFISQCVLPKLDGPPELEKKIIKVDPKIDESIKAVIAVDGGFTEAPVRDEFPFASIAFYTFGPLFFELRHLRSLDDQAFIAPEDIQRLKHLERFSFVLPLRGIRLSSESSLTNTVRRAFFNFFAETRDDSVGSLLDSLRWLLFRQWESPADTTREEIVSWCPNPQCSQQDIVFRSDTPAQVPCPSCGEDVFLTDLFRLDERVDDEQGAGAIAAYVMSVLEQLVLVHVIRAVLKIKPSMLREILFVKDGPLAFFGVVAPFHHPMRDLTSHLLSDGSGNPILRLVGVEKSGAFVEHAHALRASMPPGSLLVCDNDYIYKHIIPGDPLVSLYGSNTYYGQKVIFRAASGEMYVLTVPSTEYSANPAPEEMPGLYGVLGVINELRCNMYDDALLPIALVNKLVSLSDFPSQRILATFAKSGLAEG